jgi:hypothetical protein
MSERPASEENRWIELDLGEEERTIRRSKIDDDTHIVRYIRLSTLFLYLSNRAFIPSLDCLKRLDRWEGRLALELTVPFWRAQADSIFKQFPEILSGRAIFPSDSPNTTVRTRRDGLWYSPQTLAR